MSLLERSLTLKSVILLKKLESHIAAIWSFIHHYNKQLRLKQEHLASFSSAFP